MCTENLVESNRITTMNLMLQKEDLELLYDLSLKPCTYILLNLQVDVSRLVMFSQMSVDVEWVLEY